MEEIREYAAFISYRHKELDKSVAKKVHTLIERYVVPKEMRESWGGKKLGKVFRDEEELPVSSNLTESICTALDHTKFLIVICTPDTPESIWVEREIKYFLEHHDRSQMVAVLVDGTPETSFPKYLTTVFDEEGNAVEIVEPLAANLTGVDNRFQKGRLKKEMVRLYAAIMGCPFDSLWQREKRYKLYRMFTLVSILAAVAIIYGVSIFIKNREIEQQNVEINEQLIKIDAQKKTIESQLNQIQDKNKTITEQNEQLTVANNDLKDRNEEIERQNQEIKKNNETITRQNEELTLSEADAYIKQGELLYEKGDMDGAINSALHILEYDKTGLGKAHYGDDIEYLLSRALGAERYDNRMRTYSVIEQDEDINGLLLSQDNKHIFTLDVRGYVQCFDLENGEQQWRSKTSNLYHRYTTARQRLIELENYGIILYCGEDVVCAFSIESGKEEWRVECGRSDCTDFYAVSKDGSKIALIAAVQKKSIFETGVDYTLMILNTKDGSIENSIPVTEAFNDKGIKSEGDYSGAFSDDGKTLYGMIYYSSFIFSYEGYCVFSVNLETEELTIIREGDYGQTINGIKWPPFVIGFDYISERNSILVLHYNPIDISIHSEEISETGEPVMNYHIEYSLPKREHYGEYKTNFRRAGDEYLISCEAIALTYNILDHNLYNRDDNFGTRIHTFYPLAGSENAYVFITDNGFQHVIWPGTWMGSAAFLDRTEITYMDISDDYAYVEDQLVGMELLKSTIAAAVSITEPRKAYIMRVDKDDDYEEAVFLDGAERHSYIGSNIRIDYVGDGRLSLCEVDSEDNNKAIVSIVDAATGEILSKYEIDTTEEESWRANSLINGAVIWADGEKFSFSPESSLMGIYDLKSGKGEYVFEKTFVGANSYTMLKSGLPLQAILCLKEGSKEDYEINWRIGDGEVKKCPADSGEKRIVLGEGTSAKGALWSGKNGLLLSILFDKEDEGRVDSFLVTDTADNSENGLSGSAKVINAESTDYYMPSGNDDVRDKNLQIAMGDETKVFATLGKDGIIRVYDIDAERTVNSIETGLDIKDISNVLFFNHDSKAAVWTRGRRLYIYDIADGKLLASEPLKSENSTETTKVSLKIIEDTERDRVFFVTGNAAAMCLSSKTWKKQSDFLGFTAFCPETNEIYRVKNSYISFWEEHNAILKVKAYTLMDLRDKYISGKEKQDSGTEDSNA